MDKKTGSIIHNISISLKGNVKAAKELLSVYVAGGRAAVIGREELVSEALHALCIYTGDERAYEHYIPVRTPGLLSESRGSYMTKPASFDYYTTSKENGTGRLSLLKKDRMGGWTRITKGDDGIMAWIYISDDGDIPDAEESIIRGSNSLKTQIGIATVIYPSSETENRFRNSSIFHKKRFNKDSSQSPGTDSSIRHQYMPKKNSDHGRVTGIEKGKDHTGDIPVLIMDDEMISLKKRGSLSLGALVSGLKDSFQDIGADSGKAQDFEFMQDFCGFVFTHGIIIRYQNELGDCINKSTVLVGSADEAWLGHLQSMSRAAALLEGRNYVLPSDVDFAATSVSAAHISVSPMGIAQGCTLFNEIQKITATLADPDEKERI